MKKVYSCSAPSSRRKKQTDDSSEGWTQEIQDGYFLLRLPLSVLRGLATARKLLQRLTHDVGVLLVQGMMEDEASLKVDDGAARWGYEQGFVALGGQKVPVRRPRLRRNGQELPLDCYSLLQDEQQLREHVHGQVLRGVSTRDYDPGCAAGQGMGRSSVSRRFALVSRRELAKLCERSLRQLRVAVLVIDGKKYKQETVVVALGIDEKGRKHVLGLWDGATENATVCQGLLDDLHRRGLDPQRLGLALIDGSGALRLALKRTLGTHLAVQRCQVHKRRNVLDHLPPKWQGTAGQRLSAAYGMTRYSEALAALQQTVKWLRHLNEGAARSLEEGMEETLTLHRLGVPPLLRESLSSTNLIESCFSRLEHLGRNVKRWRPGEMVRRWVGTMLLHAEKKFRRIRGYQAMALLLSALANHNKGKGKAASA